MRLRKIQPIEAKAKKLKVCAYARVSTESFKQGSHLKTRLPHTRKNKSNPEYEFAGVYADQGISGTSENRPEFQRMMEACRIGKIDLIITKSISRFARNTLDCLNYVIELKDLEIEIIFKKENINTLDTKGAVLPTILSSLAQDESCSISENSTWGIRRQFEQDKHKMNTRHFLGYNTDEEGHLIVNRQQAKIVIRL